MVKRFFAAALAAVALSHTLSFAQVNDTPPGSAAVVNQPIEASLTVDGLSYTLKGQFSAELDFTVEDLKQGLLRANHVNLALFGVDQYALTGIKPSGKRSSALGIVRAPDAKVVLKYDDASQTVQGSVPVKLDFPQLDQLFKPQGPKDEKEADYFTTRRQDGKLSIKIALERPLSSTLVNKSDKIYGKVSIDLLTSPMYDPIGFLPKVKPYRIVVATPLAPFEVIILKYFEIAKSLCLQPVGIRSSAADPNPTGAGLAFGMPGANTQWNKADVVFAVRDWMYVTNSAWKIASTLANGTSAEETAIKGSVNADDCIEIFFVENFDPESAHGGGATWGSGTAAAKIISSDGNATFGVDLTHLAHELGHVLNMGHPGNPGSLFNASTGTLMCPSGWHNDNPKINSVDNANNVSNPLLRLVIKFKSPGPDCNGSATCGLCS
jgi:hypothetical protein